MLNIISKSIYKRKTRGPKKVVMNLISGLKAIKYPFVINKRIGYCKNIWVHDDIGALYKLQKYEDKEVVIGPNLFVNPENIPTDLNVEKYKYLQPSENVKTIWQQKGYSGEIIVWPVGIDTDIYRPVDDDKSIVMLYFKKRNTEELEVIRTELNSLNIKYEVVEYGKYKEQDYLNMLKHSKYIIWLGCYESQGIAMQEAMSMNVPVLVFDIEKADDEFDIDSTSAPYFSPICGIKEKGFSNIQNKIKEMNERFTTFKPRDYIIENLSIEKSTRSFLSNFKDDGSENKNIFLDSINAIINGLKRCVVLMKEILR